MSNKIDYKGKSYLGKIPVTLLLDDVETASTLALLARQYNIPVLEEDVTQVVTKSADHSEVFNRITEIAEEMKNAKKTEPVKEVSLTDRLIEKIKQK
ncbi:hypothetical protein FMJ29_08430 [Klebsiella michiganensis]|uniref:hypothetical protein n=1 Tax=Klebsiella michiganensis TaxID=1134687 RepID=UPI001CCDBF0A|nr:hypothetical protein [Klebsiella michiganensis]MBZ7458993.1 hypothetical protein [Klebsiella michiganensis]